MQEDRILRQLAKVPDESVERRTRSLWRGGMRMLRKLITGAVLFVLIFAVVSLVAADEQVAKTDGRISVTISSSDAGKGRSEPSLEIPLLLRAIPGETEANKLKRMEQFIKENRPKLFTLHVPKSAFCAKFMEDLAQMRNIEAIEPDFVTGCDEGVASQKLTNKLNIGHCKDMEHDVTVPYDENPRARLRETPNFNWISEIGQPPYRFYSAELDPGRKTKYSILYYNARGTDRVAGFVLLDSKKCEIKAELPGNSEKSIEPEIRGGLFEIGINVLVKYQRLVFVLLLAQGFDRFRLELHRLSHPMSIGFVCHWDYYSNAK